MSKSVRGFLLAALGAFTAAVALWLFLAPTQPALYTGNDSYQPQATYRPGGTACDPARLNRLKNQEAVNERHRCEEAAEEYRLKVDDLRQQTRAADAAQRSSQLAVDQTRLLLLGTLLGGLTLIAAFAAANFARRAAVAAENTLVHQKETGVHELRPYLHIEEMGFGNSDVLATRPDLILKIKNFGSTPGTNFRIQADWHYGTPGSPMMFNLRNCAASDEVPPGHTLSICVPPGRHGKPTSGQKIFCKFELRYNDKFGNEYGRFETYMLGPSPYGREGFRFYSSP